MYKRPTLQSQIFFKMKKYFLFLALLPLVGIAQTAAKKTKAKTVATAGNIQKPADQFLITGTITGYPDNTSIDLLNPNNGTPEASGKIVGGKFSLNGKVGSPDFKILAINSQPPYLSLFLDNSTVTISATKETFETAVVKGSPSHNQFTEFSKLTKPYEQLFTGAAADEAVVKKACAEIEQFARKNPSSYVAPLAIYRHNQISTNNELMEEMYNNLTAPVKAGSIGSYIANLIKESKKNPIGKPLADFSQEDTAGVPVFLSSLKGKYVLVDFWASWCGPCRQENPNLVAMFNRYKNKNFTVLGVSLDKTKQPWLDAIKNDGLSWTHLSDLKGWNNAVSTKFEIFSIPQNFLLDPQGNVVAKNLRGPALEAKLATIFN